MGGTLENQVNEWLGGIFGDNHKYSVSDGDLGEWMNVDILSAYPTKHDAPDHYVASVKGSVLKYNPNNKIVDISHEVNKYDLSHAAYIFKNIYEEYHNVAYSNVLKADSSYQLKTKWYG